MTLREIFLKAAAYLEQVGWTRGMLRDADGRVCALGALHGALTIPTGTHDITREAPHAVIALANSLGYDRIGDPGSAARKIAQWNDGLVSSQASVITAFRCAADRYPDPAPVAEPERELVEV